jgi:hypothetical protein
MTSPCLVLSLVACAFCADAPGGEPTGPARCYDWIVREKMRAGYLAASDPRTVAVHARAAGLNALLPKFGGLTSPPDETSLRLLREWGEAAARSGVHVLPVFNFRGGEAEKLVGVRREVTITGQRMERTPCPLDEEFWQAYVLRRAVDLATRAKELHLAGAILDPEMYGADHTVFQTPCFCGDCLREFLQAEGRSPAEPLPAARADWLRGNKLMDRFQERFVARIRGFCKQVETALHQRNPDFLLGVLLLDYPYPFMRGMAEGFGTRQYPVLAFSETTYSPGCTPYVAQQQKTFADLPAHVLFLPGLWLSQFPAENLAEQFYACARHSSGYWVYTLESLGEDVSRMPGYALREPDDRYWAAMRLANAELDRWAASGGKYESALKVRPFEPPLPLLVFGHAKPGLLVPVTEERPLALGPLTSPRLRYRNPLYLLARSGQAVEVKIANRQLNPGYRWGSHYAVFDIEGKRILEGTLKVGQSTTEKWTPERDGVYVVLVDSAQNGYELQLLSGQPFAFQATADQPLTVNGYLGRLYFHVPKGTSTLTLFVKAEGQAPGRGGKLAVIAPDGHVTARIAGDLGSLSGFPVDIPLSMQDRVWALGGEDLTNDLKLYLSPAAVSYVGADPTRLLRPK